VWKYHTGVMLALYGDALILLGTTAAMWVGGDRAEVSRFGVPALLTEVALLLGLGLRYAWLLRSLHRRRVVGECLRCGCAGSRPPRHNCPACGEKRWWQHPAHTP